MLIERIRKTIEEHNLIEKGQHIVLGLSGGPDSVCLFHVLMSLRRQLGITVHPVHLNHMFRPGEAERDQRYSQELCRRMGVECRVFTVDCAALAKELSITGEEAGRKARYDAFHETAADVAAQLAAGSAKGEDAVRNAGSESEETVNSAGSAVSEDAGRRAGSGACGAVKIAVAHNANDQAETILFRLLRGTGTDGLAGIAYSRMERGFEVIRPLLDVDREDIEAYCREHGLEPVIDHTNNEALYARNKIRLELLPYLEKEYNVNIKEALVRLGRIATEDKEYIWSQVESAYDSMAVIVKDGSGNAVEVAMDRAALSAEPGAVRHRLVMRAFAEIGLDSDISEERLRAADAIIEKKQAPKVVEFPHGYRLRVAKGRVMFCK